MAVKKYAIHHSANYTKARQPAYRVLTRAAYEKLLIVLVQNHSR